MANITDKKTATVCGFIFGFTLMTVFQVSQQSEYHVKTPEKGISCLTVDGLFGKTEFGCYQGDVQKPGACLDAVATNQYQPKATVFHFGGNCKES